MTANLDEWLEVSVAAMIKDLGVINEADLRHTIDKRFEQIQTHDDNVVAGGREARMTAVVELEARLSQLEKQVEELSTKLP